MKKAIKFLKLAALIMVVSLVIARWPGTVFGTAKVIVWLAQTVTFGTDKAFALFF